MERPRRGLPALSLRFLESLLGALASPVFVKDPAHRWVLVNDAFCEVMGRRREELLGRSDFDYFPAEQARVFWAKDDEVLAGGGMNENEEEFTDGAGRTRIIVTRKTVHVDEHGRRFLLGVFTDVTALRSTTEALRRSRDALERRVRERTAELQASNARLREQESSRTSFLNLLGHELRNPLAAIRASLPVLERAAPASEQLGRARAVVGRQVTQLTRLCDDLLDVARLANDKLELHRDVVDLGAALRARCDDDRAVFEAQGVALVAALPPEPVWASVDVGRLNQAVGNLLHNARKFTPPGGRVELTLRAGDGVARVTVRDTGIGLDPRDLERIFEPLEQAERAGGRVRDGLGLGLALVRGLAEAHGGAVVARSGGPGRGAEFELTLPLARAPAAPPRGAPAPAPPPARALEIVVIEDNADVRDTIADVLRLDGHDVQTARDGRTGVELAKAVRPDVVICDLGLPELDGFAVARALRADPALRASRLIAFSGFAQPDDVQRARDAGFDAHLPKPVRPEELARALAPAAAGA